MGRWDDSRATMGICAIDARARAWDHARAWDALDVERDGRAACFAPSNVARGGDAGIDGGDG